MKRVLFVVVALLCGCAQGLPPEDDGTTRFETDTSIPESDAGGDGTDVGGPEKDGGDLPDDGLPDSGCVATGDELCGNGLDDDCDGEVDEGFADLGNRCSAGEGGCETSGFVVCSEDALSLRCDAVAAQPGIELCGNTVDDDCDGEVDEGFDEVGDVCTSGLGACEASGTLRCNADGTGTRCSAQALAPIKEECGNEVDDDCDGEVDEGFELVGTACTAGEGICEATGVWECDGPLMTTCTATPGPPDVEICGNGIDENCDGVVDDGFDDLGQSCELTLNNCTASGSYVCDGTATTCDAVISTADEICDGLDQDCDWEIDESNVCGPCDDDAFEPNDFVERPALLARDQWHMLQSCRRNPDWFRLEGLAANERIVINVVFDHQASDLDIELLNAAGTSIATSASSSDNEQIRFVVPFAGDYTLLARQFGANSALPYRVYWYTESTQNQCVDDVYEQNDVVDAPAPIDLEQAYLGQVCAGDLDYYDLGFLTAGYGVAIEVGHDVASGDLDARLYRYGAQIARIATTTDDEFFVFWPPFAGQYTLLVEGPAGAANDYSIAYISAGEYVCGADDAFEPDDVAADAKTASILDAREGISCSDTDWIRLPSITAGERITTSLRFNHTAGDLDLYVYPVGGPYDPTTLVGSGVSTNDDEFVEFVAPVDGDYVARVVGWQGDENIYRFVWDADIVCSDRFESNNRYSSFPSLAFGTSYPLQPEQLHAGLNVCPGDFDNYELGPIGTGRTVTVTVEGSNPDFEVELFKDLTSAAFVGNTTDSTKILTWDTTADDDYTLAIRPVGSTTVNYSVVVNID